MLLREHSGTIHELRMPQPIGSSSRVLRVILTPRSRRRYRKAHPMRGSRLEGEKAQTTMHCG